MTTDYKKNDQTKTITYTYDNVGNRLKEDDGTTTTSYTYNGLDQLKTSTKEKGTAVEEVRQYDYDMNRNQTDGKQVCEFPELAEKDRFQAIHQEIVKMIRVEDVDEIEVKVDQSL